jgi:hypothetical protein
MLSRVLLLVSCLVVGEGVGFTAVLGTVSEWLPRGQSAMPLSPAQLKAS